MNICLKLSLLCFGLFITSCGSDNADPSTTLDLNTVRVSAGPTVTGVTADLIKGNVCATATPGTFVTDNAKIKITVAVLPGVTKPLPVSIDGYTVTYIGKSAANPVIPVEIGGFSSILVNGDNTLELTLLTESDKLDLDASVGIGCTNLIYEYIARYTISISEQGGKTGTLFVNVPFTVADYQ